MGCWGGETVSEDLGERRSYFLDGIVGGGRSTGGVMSFLLHESGGGFDDLEDLVQGVSVSVAVKGEAEEILMGSWGGSKKGGLGF